MPSLSIPNSITSLFSGLGPVMGEFDFQECVVGAFPGCEDGELFARGGQDAVGDKFFIPGVVTTCGLLVIALICWLRLGCCNLKRSPKPVYNNTSSNFANVYPSPSATVQKRTSQSAGSVLSNGAAGRTSLNGVPSNAAVKPSPYSNLDGMSPPNQAAYDGRSTAPPNPSSQYDGRSPAPQAFDGRASTAQQGYGYGGPYAYSDGKSPYGQAAYNNIQTVPPAHGFQQAQQSVQMSVTRPGGAPAQSNLPGGYAMSDGSTRIGSDGSETPTHAHPPVMPGVGTPYYTPPLAPPTPAAHRGTTYTDGSDDYGQPARQAYAHPGQSSGQYFPPQYDDGANPYGSGQYAPEKGGR